MAEKIIIPRPDAFDGAEHGGSSNDRTSKSRTVSKSWFQLFSQIVNRLNGVVDISEISVPDAGAAPVAYDQAHIQSLVTEVNETKARLNDVLAKMKQ
jgi:hypothetical protein